MICIEAEKGIVFLIVFVSTTIFQQIIAEVECPVDKPVLPASETNRNLIITWLVNKEKYCERRSEVEYPSYDGWYHNLAKIHLGSIGGPLLKGWPNIRTDDSKTQLWVKAWNQILSITSVCKPAGNALALFFSKQVIDEILDIKNPSCLSNEYNNPLSNSHEKEQFNYASPYIDGGTIYGSRHLIFKQINIEDGTLDIEGLLDSKTEIGNDDDVNIPIVLRIIWLRWHNHVAKRIRKICPEWTSKKVFDEARKWTIAVQQRIYAYEWLPLWTTTKLQKYERYDPTVDPQVEKLFQAAMQIPNLIQDIKGPFSGNTSLKYKSSRIDIDELLINLTSGACRDMSGLKEIENVQQQYNLPDINHARKVFKLGAYSNWNAFLIKNNLNDSMLFSIFTEKKTERLDALMGGMLESRYGTGELFVNVIDDQFRRIRDGDRFWFENSENKKEVDILIYLWKSLQYMYIVSRPVIILNSIISDKHKQTLHLPVLFSCEEIVKIGQTTFADVILTVTNIKRTENTSIFQLSHQLNNLNLTYFNNSWTRSSFKKSSSATLFFPAVQFYIFPFLLMGLMCLGTIGTAFGVILRKQIKTRKLIQKEYSIIKEAVQENSQRRYSLFPVREYTGAQEALRKVIVKLEEYIKQITIQSFSGTVLRVIDFNTSAETIVKIISLSDEPTVVIQFPHHYDLVLKFESNYLRSVFTTELDEFIASNSKLEKELITNFTWKSIKSLIVTKERRQMWLEMFFRVAFAQAFKIQHSRLEMLKVDASVAKEVIYTELTLTEFADSLSMHPDNEFVKRMFSLVDKDKNGFISFREFADLLIIFAEGSKEKKAKLLFDLYDINDTGLIPAKDFSAMIKSFLETVGGKVQEAEIQKTLTVMLRSASVKHKKNLDFDDFKKIIGDDIDNLSYAKLGFKFQEQDHASSYLAMAKRTIEAMYRTRDDLQTRFQSFTRAVDQKQAETVRPPVQKSRIHTILLFFEVHSAQLFWMIFLSLLILFIFIEGVNHINPKNKLSGINWYLFGIARAAKFPMVLSYALLLITMCKNLWMKVRELVNNQCFPFDSLIPIHIYIACLAAVFTAIHVIGEILIFYKILATSDDLSCLLNMHLMNQETLNIHLMFWLNYTVITGFALVLLVFIVNVFAQPSIRQKVYNAFYFTHNLYGVIVIIIIIHALQSLTTLVYFVMGGPLFLFAVDYFVSLKRKKIELPVIRAELFPSNVICLILRRPKNFQFKVGQWVRLAVPQLSRHEFHSASLSAAPHEPYLRIFVRPTNPWACQVRSLFEGPGSGYAAAPVRVLLDGPYGEGAQHWRLCDVVILVGGGSGVGPFAAILKDVRHALQGQAYLHCQKAYFIWVTKTQRQFEWMVDLIKETEDIDLKHFLSCHIFITELYAKFDLRTIMLYICEKHYQRISGKSLFTNLRAVTHFGRPHFTEFFKTVQSLHPTAKLIGVFSSGPSSLSRALDAACSHLNSQSEQRFEHHTNKI